MSTPDPRGGQGLTYDCVWQRENGARRLLRVRQCQQPWGCVHGFQVGAGGEVGVQVGVRARARVEIGILFLVSLAQAVQFWCEPLRLLESRAEARSLARGVLPTTNRAGRSFPFRTCPSSRPFRLTDRRMVTLFVRRSTDLGQGLLADSSEDNSLSVGIFPLAQGLTVDAHGRDGLVGLDSSPFAVWDGG